MWKPTLLFLFSLCSVSLASFSISTVGSNCTNGAYYVITIIDTAGFSAEGNYFCHFSCASASSDYIVATDISSTKLTCPVPLAYAGQAAVTVGVVSSNLEGGTLTQIGSQTISLLSYITTGHNACKKAIYVAGLTCPQTVYYEDTAIIFNSNGNCYVCNFGGNCDQMPMVGGVITPATLVNPIGGLSSEVSCTYPRTVPGVVSLFIYDTSEPTTILGQGTVDESPGCVSDCGLPLYVGPLYDVPTGALCPPNPPKCLISHGTSADAGYLIPYEDSTYCCVALGAVTGSQCGRFSCDTFHPFSYPPFFANGLSEGENCYSYCYEKGAPPAGCPLQVFRTEHIPAVSTAALPPTSMCFIESGNIDDAGYEIMVAGSPLCCRFQGKTEADLLTCTRNLCGVAVPWNGEPFFYDLSHGDTCWTSCYSY